ncbi:SpoIIE family protein phosphatase [Nocardia gipuzkoensis]|uniref:SpoIIE family protein phosphatase n=1 Tax=Nocardia gipuzkoensis TaxID=2749991 RepID=UPI001E582C96|nr:SpoIIE family protein phosphatase [Nocardia gipuzkoensis]UGT65933.1 SpoIIE family protein phosphatase [Nocardia gipuzkoensis]
MTSAADDRDAGCGLGAEPDDHAAFAALLEDSVEDLYEHAPCGYLSTSLDGRIAKVNATLLDWLGYRREELVGRKRFSELLTVGGRLYHETHFAPLLRMQGEVRGIALEMKTTDGRRLPVLVTSLVKTGSQGQPLLIRTTVFDARERRAYETELLRARREAEEERERLQRLNAALQVTLLPPQLPEVPGLEVAAHYHIASADEVGGDFYDLFPLDGDTWGMFLGDVCGKGAPAAVLTSVARYTLRTATAYTRDPAAVLDTLNTTLIERDHGHNRRFCTIIFGLITPTPHRGGCDITLAGGGHPPAVLIHPDGNVEEMNTRGGQLIGAIPHAQIVTRSVRLEAGDTLLLYTDGLTEARTSANGGRYSDRALLEFVRALAPVTASRTVEALRELLDSFGSGLEDDTAVLAIHALPPPHGTAR